MKPLLLLRGNIMGQGSGIREVAWVDIAGGGQVVLDGNYAYVGHMQPPHGTSVLDVTDPRQPKMLAHIPGEPGQGESGGAQMVRACAGESLPRGDKSKTYILRTFGNAGHERCVGTGGAERCKVAIQTNNVEVDDRGYVYIVDRANTGMHILELNR